jgi:hypothetical protein
LEDVLTWALRLAALKRLGKFDVVGQRAEALLGLGMGLGDAWLAYVALAPAEVIGDIREGGRAEDAHSG